MAHLGQMITKGPCKIFQIATNNNIMKVLKVAREFGQNIESKRNIKSGPHLSKLKRPNNLNIKKNEIGLVVGINNFM